MQVYAAAALIEWYSDHAEGPPRNIFERGLAEGFLKQPDFVLQYADFLQQLGDKDNTRALFERVISHDDCSADARGDALNLNLLPCPPHCALMP